MCQLASASDSCKSNLDPSTKVQEPDMLSPLVPRNLTSQPQEKTHLSLAIKEAKCSQHCSSNDFNWSSTLLSFHDLHALSWPPGGAFFSRWLSGDRFCKHHRYSILSGLAMGMEPICGQAFGAKSYKLLGLTMQRTILLLILISFPISFLWFNMKNILLCCGQEYDIATEAQTYILYSLPDLILQSLLHPLRIYLRTQSITLPLTYCAALSILLHIPINYFLVSVLNLGIKGVALSGIWTNFNLVSSLIVYVMLSGVHKKTWGGISLECLRGWKSLLNLAIPSCISVCLEWWWYEIMILLCGLLLNPRATVASMGILIQTTALIYIFPSSLSFGVSTRVGNELGANNPQKAKLAAIIGLCLSFGLGFSALFFAIMVRKVWASMFTEDAEIIALTSMVLPIIGLCELGNCPQTTGCGVLRGTARPKMGANINLGCFYLVGMPVAIWLSFYAGFDFKGLWLGLLAAQGSCVATMLLVLTRTDWERQALRAKELTGNVNTADDIEEDDTIQDDKRQPSTSSNHNDLLA
ncbi:hypothetical protein GH714_002077 [Hevea brasiliensis]|uniref:Protein DETOXIFICATION n=1 Tax=Hevea brasiliensis TaxID=3981 RepID=A0A6A6LB24_HEVBR|nr:hypothetical protein GH714_002077 [Hevea brasiliensis]